MKTNRQAYQTRQERSSLGALIAGDDSLPRVESLIHSWKTLKQRNERVCCPHLRQVLEQITLEKQNEQNCVAELSVAPLATCARHSARTFGLTPHSNAAELGAFSSPDN